MLDTVILTPHFKNLLCSKCGREYDINRIHTFSPCCQKPLSAQYNFPRDFDKKQLIGRESTMWRYKEMLPLMHEENCVSLGEGFTPMIKWNNLSTQYSFTNLLMKDEGLNPTGSFKARGLSVAVSKAKELGVGACIVPTAGNAGGAMSAYCARAGIKSTVVMPRNTPKLFKEECELYGAELILVDGLIDECGHLAGEIAKKTNAFNMATLKEPYRLEGKKTIGYEIAEQYNWSLPDTIIYPTGGGTGLIGIWKAFHEMIALGWLPKDIKLPKMIVVQSDLCAPVCQVYNGLEVSEKFQMSIANGLSVPKAFGIDMIMDVLNSSQGQAVTVSDQEILSGVREIGKNEGIVISPEGAAIWEALKVLVNKKIISREEKILLINTGSGFKYMENY